jgi:hypothetical protein
MMKCFVNWSMSVLLRVMSFVIKLLNFHTFVKIRMLLRRVFSDRSKQVATHELARSFSA